MTVALFANGEDVQVIQNIRWVVVMNLNRG